MTDETEGAVRAYNRVTLGGEEITIGEFSGYKAIKAMEIVADVNEAYQAVLGEGHKFTAEFRETAAQRIPRAEARRRYGPVPLTTREPATDDAGELILDPDGEPMVRIRPVLEDGRPVLGPDPLAHLTEEDWAGSDQALTIHEDPKPSTVYMHVAPVAFKLARTHVLRLLALVLATNSQLEKWDEESADIDAELDTEGKRLLHRCKADELVRLGVATIEVGREQLRDPFEEIEQGIRSLTAKRETPQDRTPAAAPMEAEPASPDGNGETADTPDSPGSQSPSSGSGGAGATPSTAPPGAPSSPPVPA